MASVVVLFSALALSAGQLGAPDRLITPQGIELSADGRTFALFAALNALGYSEETEHLKPPLSAPVFHDLREKTREAMRPLVSDGKLDVLKRTFETTPAELESYMTAVLSYDLALDKAVVPVPPELSGLVPAVEALQKLANDPELAKVFDQVAYEQRQLMKGLTKTFAPDFEKAGQVITAGFRAPVAVTVVPNPLDAQGAVRRVVVGTQTYLVVGPSETTARRALMVESIRRAIEVPAREAAAKNARLKKSFDTLAGSSKVVRSFGSADVFLLENLSRALAHKVLGGTEDELIEREQQAGMAWIRSALRATDGWKPTEPLAAEVAKAVAKVAP